MNMVALGEFMPSRIPSVNPAKHPDETFELWSIPAFDDGRPEILAGTQIGSSKKCVEPGDVLLSRIVPHIRRSWVVRPGTDNRQIASGEWITFRGDAFDPDYLRHILTSDPFHIEFMQTVAGVGGSLLRARPESVKAIKIPLPPLEEQKRIAGILDQAAELCRLRTRALDKLNTLGQAIFHEMFGRDDVDFSTWKREAIGDLISEAQIGAVRGAKDMSEDKPIEYLRMDSIGTDGSLTLTGLRRVDATDHDLTKYSLRSGDLLFNTRNTKELVGKTAVLRSDFAGIYNNNILRCRFDEANYGHFLDAFFRSKAGSMMLSNIKSGTTSVFAIYQKALMGLRVPVPSSDLLNDFSARMMALAVSREPYESAALSSKALFASLQHRAFRGEL